VLKSRYFSTLLVPAVALVSAPAMAQVEQLQVIVPGEIPMDSTGNRAIRESLAQTEAAALQNAWIVIKRHPDIALKVRNLTIEQNAALAQGLKPRCQSVMLNYDLDKKLKRLQARYRFDCNLLDIETDIDRLVRSAGPVEGGPARPRIATFFIVKEVASLTSYDQDIDRQAKAMASQGVSKNDRVSVSYNADLRSRQSSTEGYGEGHAAVNDSLSTRNQEKGRAQVSSTENSDVTAREEASLKASGRTISRAAEQGYRPASPEQLNATLSDVFKNGRSRITHYGDIYSQCPGPNPDTVTAEFGRKSEDLSTPVRTGIINAVRKCGFKYVLLGDALVDTTQPDPSTGSPRVSVILTARIWDVSDSFPEVVATVQKTASASNSNFNIAKSDAMLQASQRVGEEVLSRLSAEGVR